MNPHRRPKYDDNNNGVVTTFATIPVSVISVSCFVAGAVFMTIVTNINQTFMNDWKHYYLATKNWNELVDSPSFSSSQTTKQQQQQRFVYEFAHDDPRHPWHWTRENVPNVQLGFKKDCKGDFYKDMYQQFHSDGYVIFESCSLNNPDNPLLDLVANVTKSFYDSADRVINSEEKPINDLTIDPDTLEFIEYIHGCYGQSRDHSTITSSGGGGGGRGDEYHRRVFPYQTLNFPKGTQQAIHSDLIHFDTMPRTLMTAAWVALEDMNENNGPLLYYPKSHQYGYTWDYNEIQLPYKHVYDVKTDTELQMGNTQQVYAKELKDILENTYGLKPQIASTIERGQSFIWAAGLVHGGSIQKDPTLSRLSQVTHYFFEGSTYYWQPRTSEVTTGHINYIPGIPPCTAVETITRLVPSTGIGMVSPFKSCAEARIEQRWKKKDDGEKTTTPSVMATAMTTNEAKEVTIDNLIPISSTNEQQKQRRQRKRVNNKRKKEQQLK